MPKAWSTNSAPSPGKPLLARILLAMRCGLGDCVKVVSLEELGSTEGEHVGLLAAAPQLTRHVFPLEAPDGGPRESYPLLEFLEPAEPHAREWVCVERPL